MKKIVFFYCIVTNSVLFAQNLSPTVINSAGGSIENGSFKLDFSVGEAAITYLANGDKKLYQGFLQPTAFHYAPTREIKDLAYLKVYPNPTTNILNLDFLEKSIEAVQIEVLDCNSKTLKKVNTDSNTTISIDLSDLPTQLYFLKIQMKDKTFYEKIMVQR
jgi:hypothetical protein